MNAIPNIFNPAYFFDLDLMDYGKLFDGVSAVWEAVARMQEGRIVDSIVRARCASVSDGGGAKPHVSGDVEVRVAGGAEIGTYVAIAGDGGLVCVDEGAKLLPGTVITAGRNAVYIGRGAIVGPHAHLDASKGGMCVGEQARVRQCAYLRELTLIGRQAVVGNSCEIKCSLIGREAEVPHFNYVGDSIFGYKAHTGAGVKISNVKIAPGSGTGNTVKVRHEGLVFDTKLRKFGAILGDRAQMGCNSVANPGTLIGRNSIIYAGSSVRGFIPENTLVKLRASLEFAPLKQE